MYTKLKEYIEKSVGDFPNQNVLDEIHSFSMKNFNKSGAEICLMWKKSWQGVKNRNEDRCYYLDGMLHREGGPAIEGKVNIYCRKGVVYENLG